MYFLLSPLFSNYAHFISIEFSWPMRSCSVPGIIASAGPPFISVRTGRYRVRRERVYTARKAATGRKKRAIGDGPWRADKTRVHAQLLDVEMRLSRQRRERRESANLTKWSTSTRILFVPSWNFAYRYLKAITRAVFLSGKSVESASMSSRERC